MPAKQATVVGMVLALGFTVPVLAAKKEMKMAPANTAMMQPTPEMMARMTPGPEHKELDPLVGKWNAKVTGWMAPGAAPMTSDGTAENSWVLNNHFIKQEFNGTWAGQPFSGIGFTGYDKVRGEYQSIWLDNMSTGIMYGTGPSVTAGKPITQEGTFGCPMTGEKNRWYRSETQITGPDSFVYRSYGKTPQGQEFKGMEIVYTRAK